MHHDDNQPSPLETFASLAASGIALVLMFTASYFTPDLLARLGQ